MDNEIIKRLYELSDEGYKRFHSALMPGVAEERIIGVRVPVLRSFSKELIKEGREKSFIAELPHFYYEENNLHAFIICGIKDFDELIKELDRFLPYIDNWATCDSLRPAAFSKNKERLLPHIFRWLESESEFTVRFAIEMLMVHFLKEDFSPVYPDAVSRISSDKYYINMMIAWYFATALAERWDDIILFLQENRLSDETHNRAIRKAVESLRISHGQKEYLRTLRR